MEDSASLNEMFFKDLLTTSKKEIPLNDYVFENDVNDENTEDSDENYEPNLFHFNHVQDVVSILIKNDHVSNENALEININLQKMLMGLKEKVQLMLKKCISKYDENDKILNMKSSHLTQAFKSHINCTAPFFKDRDNFSAPPNRDYLYRKNVLHEIFPLDLNPRVSQWTLTDKINLIQGVKKQIVSFIHRKKRKRKNSEVETDFDAISDKLEELLPQVKETEFEICWYRISMEDCNSRHTEKACEGMWEMYLKPGVNRNEFTTEESDKLLSVAYENEFQNWKEISRSLPGRTEYQCILQFHSSLYSSCKLRKKWTKAEDDLLLEAVEASRTGSVITWNKVLSYFPHKTKSQIYNRYASSLTPDLQRGKFTQQEDCIILAAVHEYGENFYKMPRSLFPNRTLIQIRNRYKNVLKYIGKHKTWNVEDDKKLIQLVNEHGTNWKKISEILKSHTRTSCRTRYSVILKHIQKTPNATLESMPRKPRKCRTEVSLNNWADKIVELASDEGNKNDEPQPKRIRKKKELYRDRLRTNEKNYYYFFKYSYDFKYKTFKDISLTYKDNVHILRNALFIENSYFSIHNNQEKFTKTECKILRNCFREIQANANASFYSEDVMFNELKTFQNLTLPPNWCSLLGLRGVCIQLSSDGNDNKNLIQNKFIKTDKNKIENEKAKYLFKQRFFTIFYKTFLLSKLATNVNKSPNSVYTIHVIFDNDCENENSIQ